MIAALPLLVALSSSVAGATPVRVLVLDFRDDGVGKESVHVVQETLTARLAADRRLEIMTMDDMRRVLDVEAQKAAVGCSEESCLAELADALGAQLLVYGNAGKLGDLVVVNVSMFDAAKGKSVGRETIEVARLDDLPDPLRVAGDALIARQLGPGNLAPVVAPGPPVLLLAGVAVAGVGAVALLAGGAVAAVGATGVSSENAYAAKSSSAFVRDTGLVVAVVGVAVLVAGAAVAVAGLVVE